jgi:hypothetical protein
MGGVVSEEGDVFQYVSALRSLASSLLIDVSAHLIKSTRLPQRARVPLPEEDSLGVRQLCGERNRPRAQTVDPIFAREHEHFEGEYRLEAPSRTWTWCEQVVRHTLPGTEGGDR